MSGTIWAARWPVGDRGDWLVFPVPVRIGCLWKAGCWRGRRRRSTAVSFFCWLTKCRARAPPPRFQIDFDVLLEAATVHLGISPPSGHIQTNISHIYRFNPFEFVPIIPCIGFENHWLNRATKKTFFSGTLVRFNNSNKIFFLNQWNSRILRRNEVSYRCNKPMQQRIKLLLSSVIVIIEML